MIFDKTLTAKMGALLPIGCALLLGCAGTQKKPPPPPPAPVTAPVTTPVATTAPDKPVEVMLRLDAKSEAKGAFELQPGDVLKSGDRLAVTVRVDQPAYVYVTVISSDGSSKRLFPKEGDQLVNPSEPLRIPKNPDKWIPLDSTTGQENVFVYAAKKPLQAEEQLTLLNADVETVKAAAAKRSAKPKARKGKDAPSHLTADSRGVILEEEEGTPSSTVDANGVVKKRFIVRHK